ncbi:MAG: NAD(P)H-binding protein, partial [Alphaproteobacteria bacterium]
LRSAFKEIECLFLLCGAQPGMDILEINAIEAAKQADVGRIVKISVPNAAETGIAALQRLHGRSEAALGASGIAWTVLRPNAFMQNLYGPTQGFDAGRICRLPLGEAKYCFIDAQDIAATALAALTENGHAGKVYDLTGPEALSYAEAARIVSKATGETFTFVDISPQESRAGLLAAGIEPWFADEILEWFSLFRHGQVGALSNAVETVTGRAPRALSDFVQRNLAHFGAPGRHG